METNNAYQSYILDCESRGLSIHTMRVYQQRLRYFIDFLVRKGVSDTEQMNADHYLNYVRNSVGYKSRYIDVGDDGIEISQKLF